MLISQNFSISNQSPIKRVFVFLLVTLFTGFIIFSFRVWDEVNESVESQIHFLNQLLTQNTQDTFKQHESIMRVLGGRLLELDVINKPELSRALIDDIHNINPGMAGFGAIKTNGQIVIISGIPADKKLPNLMMMKESAKSFKKVLSSDEMLSGRSYLMKVLNKWVIPIRLRIKNNKGKIKFVIGAGIDIDAIETAWNGILLPPGYKIQLMRPDGYWQYSRPLNNVDKINFYPKKAHKELYDHISFLKNSNIESHHFVFDNQHYHASYIKKAGLYSLVSIGESTIVDQFSFQMVTPILLLLAFLVGGTLIFIIALRDHNKHESTLLKKANYDDLTGLPNRTLAKDRLEQEINHAQRNNLKVFVVYFDLDQFKRINDGYGHIVGDELLKECAVRLNNIVRKVDTVARLSGDEFLFILHSQINTKHIEIIIKKVQDSISKAFLIDNHEIYINSSMGISIYPDDSENSEQILMAADTALYKAKESGRNTHCFYSRKMNEEIQRRIKIDNELRHALENDEFHLVYQPKFSISTMRCIGAEALLRWNNKNLGEVSPVDFIPIAEDSGLIIEIGDYVINKSCEDLKTVLNKAKDDFSLAINISPVQLRTKDFVKGVSNTIQSYKLPPSLFEFEITESTLIDNPDEIHLLEAENFKLAIDDFGTGFSSLSYLSKFPISTLKIDRAFVNNIKTDIHDAQLVIAIINMGKSLELNVVAEGIETKEQLDFLKEAGCDLGQGYYYSKPIQLNEFKEKFLQDI